MPAATSPAAPPPSASAPPAAVRAEHVVKVYGQGETRVRALDGVSVELPAGRFTAVMGPSGSGKSTLLHCLAGLDTVDSGAIWVGDVQVTGLDEKGRTLLRRDRLGFVFQSFNLVPSLTVRENITLPQELAGRTVDQAWLEQVIDAVGLRDRLRHRPTELSGGQQQRVAAARALAGRPQVVFADEPTGNLDSRSGGELLAFMRHAVDGFGQSIVMVTHDPVAAATADQMVFLADGQVVDTLAAPTVDSVLDRIRSLER